jgi:hypothetical protein
MNTANIHIIYKLLFQLIFFIKKSDLQGKKIDDREEFVLIIADWIKLIIREGGLGGNESEHD